MQTTVIQNCKHFHHFDFIAFQVFAVLVHYHFCYFPFQGVLYVSSSIFAKTSTSHEMEWQRKCCSSKCLFQLNTYTYNWGILYNLLTYSSGYQILECLCAFSKQADRKRGSYDEMDAMGELNFLWSVTIFTILDVQVHFWFPFVIKKYLWTIHGRNILKYNV